MRWIATYSDGTQVHESAGRWAELDRRHLVGFAVYAHADDLLPVLKVDVPVGYRILQRVRHWPHQGRELGMVALESDDRSDVTVWTMENAPGGIVMNRYDGYSASLYEPELFDFESVRTD